MAVFRDSHFTYPPSWSVSAFLHPFPTFLPCLLPSLCPFINSFFPFLPLLPFIPHSLPLSIFPPIQFDGTGLWMITAAGCICFQCAGAPLSSQQMCINRPSGVVIANKDRVCGGKRIALVSRCHKHLCPSQLPLNHIERGFMSDSKPRRKPLHWGR